MIREDEGILRLRITPNEARARLAKCFDADGPDVYQRVGRREVIAMDRHHFALRHRAPDAAVQYVLEGIIEEDPHGARIALERRLRGGMIATAVFVAISLFFSVFLFVALLWLGRGGITEWLGLLFLPWVLVTLAQGFLGRIAAAKREITALRHRLDEVFADAIVAAEEGPYR